MEKRCEEIFERRRSYYGLMGQSPVTDAQIEEMKELIESYRG